MQKFILVSLWVDNEIISCVHSRLFCLSLVKRMLKSSFPRSQSPKSIVLRINWVRVNNPQPGFTAVKCLRLFLFSYFERNHSR